MKKRLFKWMALAVLLPVLLVAAVGLMLYLPPIQAWAAGQAARIASEQTGLQVTVEHVRLRFPLDLSVQGLRALQPNDSLPQLRDTVADVEELVATVRLWPLLRRQVEVERLDFNNVRFNTTHFVPQAHVRGRAEKLHIESRPIDLRRQTVRINEARIDGAEVAIALSDTVPEDTSTTENRWKISVDRLQIARSHVSLSLPGDSLRVGVGMGNAVAEGAFVDLLRSEYRVESLRWDGGTLALDQPFVPRRAGLDPNHVAVDSLRLAIDSLYYCAPQLNASLKSLALREKSGLSVTQMSGQIAMDSTRLLLPGLKLRTTESALNAQLMMDLDAFSPQQPGQIRLRADGMVGKQDVVRALGGLPSAFMRRWPNEPLTLKTVLTGNLKHIELSGLNAKLPSAFNVNASGTLANLDDTDRLKADLKVDAKGYNLDFLAALLPPSATQSVHIPRGIGINGRLKADGPQYDVDFAATESGGTLSAKGRIDTRTMAYSADLSARAVQISHFLRGTDMGALTAKATLSGRGTDLLSPRAVLDGQADITSFRLGAYRLDGISGTAAIRNGRARADIQANNDLLSGHIALDGLTNTRTLRATVAADIQHADLYSLHLTDQPMAIGLCCHVDVATDMDQFYQLQGMASDLTIRYEQGIYRPDDIVMDVLTRRDTTHAVVDCGDFHLDMDASGGYRQLMHAADLLAAEAKGQLSARHIDQMALRRLFPTARISLQSGRDNIVSRLLERSGYSFADARIDMTTSPQGGLNGSVRLQSLMSDSIQLDTVRLNFLSDSTNITFNGQVRNNRRNPQFVFNTLFDGYFLEQGAGINLRYYDEQDRLGVRLGAEAAMEPDGIRLHLKSKDAVIAYRDARINDDNYVFLADNSRVSAALDILGDDGTGIKLYSNDDNRQALQDLTLSLNRLNLEEILSVVPYMPRISGFVNGDYHFVQDERHITVSSSMNVEKMAYEGSMMGNIGTEFVYMPTDDGAHYVDGTLSVEGNEVGTVAGTYRAEGKDNLDITLSLERLPMSLANGFVPDQLFGLRGYGEGELKVKGSTARPQVDGEIFLDSCHLVSVPYGLDLRFSDDPVRIVGSHLLFENFEMYAYNNNPLNVSGNIDFTDPSQMTMNVRMRADNFELINAKENAKSVAFGRAFVNFFGRMSGPIDNLSMRGKLDVLGTTDLSYVLRDSPLTTDNQLDELVKFTDFTDTTETVIIRPPLSGFSMDLTMDVSKGAHVMAYLNADKSNYIDLMGGGTLRMQYNNADNLRLAGRYTLSNGEMKYSLPIIPLKTFAIQDGSYIEFTGDPMNPTLNITATEQTKATVSNASGVGRGVNFDCGVVITKTLSDMGLEFTLDAPEDMALHNELQQMSIEQRGKLAVTMLTTGMYLADGNTSGFSMNGALSSFLENEINNITGNALRTLDLSVGLDNATDASGTMHTDYSFKFAKRFWNNRVKISVGGVVSTGSDAAYRNQSFFDNVSLEYRLDDTANKYVKLFFDNNSYDWLEGYTQQYGGGFIWRRTLQHFGDIFRLKSTETPPDTLKTKTP